MKIERMMLVEAVLDGKLASDILSQQDLDDYQFVMDVKSFEYAIADSLDRNPCLTFGEVENGMMN